MQNAAVTLSNQSTRHRFRAAMIRRPDFGRRVKQAPAAGAEKGWKLTTQDVKDFLMAYCACFLAVMGLIA